MDVWTNRQARWCQMYCLCQQNSIPTYNKIIKENISRRDGREKKVKVCRQKGMIYVERQWQP